MTRTKLLVVQGPPAAGKTSLSKQLSKRLNVGVIAKDDIKELLYDKIGAPIDRNQSRIYGKATMSGLFAISREVLVSGIDHIIESAFHAELANKDIENLIGCVDAQVIQIYCFARSDVMVRRFNQRLDDKSRHSGHLDTPKTVEDFMSYNEVYARLNIDTTIDVDTTSFDAHSFEELIRKIRHQWETK